MPQVTQLGDSRWGWVSTDGSQRRVTDQSWTSEQAARDALTEAQSATCRRLGLPSLTDSTDKSQSAETIDSVRAKNLAEIEHRHDFQPMRKRLAAYYRGAILRSMSKKQLIELGESLIQSQTGLEELVADLDRDLRMMMECRLVSRRQLEQAHSLLHEDERPLGLWRTLNWDGLQPVSSEAAADLLQVAMQQVLESSGWQLTIQVRKAGSIGAGRASTICFHWEHKADPSNWRRREHLFDTTLHALQVVRSMGH